MRAVDLQTLFSQGMLGGLTDGELLERFGDRHDPGAGDAFAVLVERHGPMVWGVCRRVLANEDLAADAFQATFLVLVRRASAVRVDDSLGPWLYGVSRRVAARARTTALRRRGRETGGVETVATSAPTPDPDPDRAEWLAILDEEIGRLPEHQRAAVVLCDLEGLPHGEAALRLNCPVGTVESRLSRGRQRLRDRLIRRGLAPAAATLWAETARAAATTLPATLTRPMARFVIRSAATGIVPGAVTNLAAGVIRMMEFAKLKSLAAVGLALILATAGGSVAFQVIQQPTVVRAQAPTASPPPIVAVAVAAPDPAINRALARQQLALIDEIWAMQSELVRNARISPIEASFGLWGRQRLDMLHKAGADRAEIVAALEKYINDLKDNESIAKELQQNARGTHLGVLTAQYQIREAEIWLNEEKAR